ncbi:hypothetical protein AHiyo1_37610 [Arthrobacter sp. Hiyo1]|nr:hypothetical protein AHiyo1_37610 [Arthrobacter sp. Hiyo1]
MIGEMLAKGGTTAAPGWVGLCGHNRHRASAYMLWTGIIAPPAPGPGTQKQAAVSRFRPRAIPGPSRAGNKGTRLLVDPRRKPANSRSGLRDIDRIVNSDDWYRMIPSTTYFLSLREL